MTKKILGIGNAIVDVFSFVDNNFLKENNLIKGSMKLLDKTEFEKIKMLKFIINVKKIFIFFF